MAINRQDFRQFVNNLLRATEAKRVKWTDTPEDDLFRTVLKEGAVLVEQIRPAPDQFKHRVTLLNARDQTVADFPAAEPEEEDLLRALFEAARDSALRTEDVFRNLAGELETLTR